LNPGNLQQRRAGVAVGRPGRPATPTRSWPGVCL
jgi:hypothetical protein